MDLSYGNANRSTLSPRERRLQSDYEDMRDLLRESTILEVDARGQPPQLYRVRFHGWGLRLGAQGQVEAFNVHEATIELGAAYPRMMPTIIWKSDIFHPNISHHGVVCLGGYQSHWVPSLTLSQLCSMLWDMVRYRNFDINSPYNREAALWARAQAPSQFPVDPRPLRDRPLGSSASAFGASFSKPVCQPQSVESARAEITFL